MTDIGQTNALGGSPDLWLKPRMTVAEQLQFKFIACIEGNDVATNLKWVMSSNSLPVMPAPTKETWFREARLRPGENYVELSADLSDLPQRLDYYLSHPSEAREIIANNHRYIGEFRQSQLPATLLTLRRYLSLQL